jgi:multidrug resistance efflux pump
LVILFIPWTQVVSGKGKVTALYPEQRPQSIQSPIPGRIDTWHITEGDTVQKGDTLLVLGEVKNEYFDPEIIERMKEELHAKEKSIVAYNEKAQALFNQADFLQKNMDVKLLQTKQKIQADSNAFAAAEIKRNLSYIQFQRADTLFNEGAVSRFDWEKRRQAYQDGIAKAVETRNKYRNSLSDLQSVFADYSEKISKAESDLYSAQSAGLSAQADVAKLRVKISNMEVRRSYYQVRAPQDGLITRILKTGVGENIKEGEAVLEIMPLDYELAVEMFVRPVDLPLVQKGQHARIEFDGWPAIVFSGWPNTSFGTFGAKVFAIDNVLDKNGRYRVLLRKDEIDAEWPEPLRFGAGTQGMLLLNDVPIWYEIWRQLNGFPPEFYESSDEKDAEIKRKPKAGYSK